MPVYSELLPKFNDILPTLEHNQDVFGVDIGYRYEGQKRTSDLAVRIHAERLIPFISGHDVQLIHYIASVNATHRILETEVDRRIPRLTMQPGISIGYDTAGTLGILGYDVFTGSPKEAILTCHHLVKGGSRWPIMQPSFSVDHGGRQHIIGLVDRIDPNGDAAVISLLARRQLRFEQFGTNDIITAIAEPELGQVVMKSGRSTGITEGIIDGIGTYFVKTPLKMRQAISALRIVPVSPENQENYEVSFAGDSGALWYKQGSKEGIGMLFYGEGNNVPPYLEFSLAQPLQELFKRMHFTFNKIV
ncbi:MAG: trypsin-like peptidase domain-containing protein [Saprospiraceae bacterium]|uniref:Trypsin-like peptidase domain-containing protein n=1 Tax=Candidatus Opimibacter skivensis TaxID=2982028 RepID=A0A9D7XTA2_9BACT|nr:trypsin-like peptidase domain-containing protein [Candidatus Opimibacter skivensis]